MKKFFLKFLLSIIIIFHTLLLPFIGVIKIIGAPFIKADELLDKLENALWDKLRGYRKWKAMTGDDIFIP